MKRIATYLTNLITQLFRKGDPKNYDSEAGLFI
jgi:hypothetical protein